MKQVACPRCAALAPFGPENRWRPFCSERCKTIDLGAWATEAYRMPAEEDDAPPEDPSASATRPES